MHKQAVLPAAGIAQYEHEPYEGGYNELPSVDDLEVAAAAAAAAMDEAGMDDDQANSDDEDEEVNSTDED